MTSKGFCADSRASSGHNKGNARIFEGQKMQTRRYEDKPRTDLGHKRTREGQPPSATLPVFLF